MTRLRIRRTGLSVVSACVFAVIAGVASGCGSSASSAAQPSASSSTGAPASVGTSADSHRLAAIKYARCMRAHGVNVLDPDQNGNTKIDAPDTSKAVVDRANHACQKLRAAALGAGMSPAQHTQALTEMTNYTRCMRAHQIPMADPFTGANGGVGYSIPPGISPSSQLYKKADAACKHFLPNGG